MPHLGKLRTFAGSGYHRCKRRPPRALDPAFAGRKRFCTPSLDRLLQALERSPAKRRIAERSAGQLVSARADHDTVLTGESLQAGSDMCRAAEHFPPIGGLAGHAADDDHPGVNPDAYAQANEATVRQQKLVFLDRRGNGQRGADRAFRIIFMGLRDAKKCEQPVTNHSGDMTAVVANLLVADIAVSSDNREELLGIDPLTQGRRADDVDKCHGELPAFGMQSFILDIRRRLRPLKSARTIWLRLAVHDPPCSVSAVPAVRQDRRLAASG